MFVSFFSFFFNNKNNKNNKKKEKKRKIIKKNTNTIKIKKNTNKRINISAALRKKVWYTYIGKQHGISPCLCCRSEEIGQLDFHVGHVVSIKEGGDTTINNLRPICSTCNLSMGSTHMSAFIKTNGF
jgi:5-methylcytosine-specific restriction endonuclease McrA